MKVQVVLPTKNEEESITHVIKEIRKTGLNDIFVVDEHSTDKTIELAKKQNVPVYQREGTGKGYGVKKALEMAEKNKCDILVLQDCDCTYPPREIPGLLKYIPEYDMVVGIRDFSRIKTFHRLPNRVHTWAINLLFCTRLKDINSGQRIIKVSKFRDSLTAKGFDIEANITTTALKKRLKIKEVPIEYLPRRGQSKIKIKDGFLILWRIIRDRF